MTLSDSKPDSMEKRMPSADTEESMGGVKRCSGVLSLSSLRTDSGSCSKAFFACSEFGSSKIQS